MQGFHCPLSPTNFLTKLNQDAIRAFGVKKTDQLVVSPFFGHFIDELKSLCLEAQDFAADVIHGKGNMVHAFSFFIDEFCDYTIFSKAFQQFHLAFSRLEKSCFDFFRFYGFCFVAWGAQQFFKQGDCIGKGANGECDVFNLVHGWEKVLTKSTIHLSNLLKSMECVTLHNNRGNMEVTAMMSGIYISDKAKTRVESLLAEEGKGEDYFVRVSVVSGGCSGLTYKMDFDNEMKAGDQVFEDKGMKLVTDRKSILYLFNTTLEFSDGLDGKGFHFMNPNASRTCACGESFSV